MGFQQGLSGLNSTSRQLEVIGHNIANANTVGVKASRAEFADMYAASLAGTGVSEVGLGARVSAVTQQFTQGNIKATDGPMDLAINGGGFFQMMDVQGLITYSRNGQFRVDRDGFISSQSGHRLVGFSADAQGVIQPASRGPLRLPTEGVTPRTTSRISMELNLDSRRPSTAPALPPAIDFADANTYNNATAVTAYDDKGQEIALTYYFQKAGNDTWNLFATANGTPLAGTAAAPLPLTTITFSPDGRAPIAPAAPVVFNIPVTTNSVGATTVPLTGVQLDLSQATQFGSAFGVTDLKQDGYSAGVLAGVTVEDTGIIMARYTNGQTRPAGQVELSNFRNPQGLQPLGNNGWARTYASGDPTNGTPGQGPLGVLQAGAVEESNVDLTGELVSMITAQRIYQANAQTIKTEDQILQTLVNLR